MADYQVDDKIYSNINNKDCNFLAKNVMNFDNQLLDKNIPSLINGLDERPPIVVSSSNTSKCTLKEKVINTDISHKMEQCNTSDSNTSNGNTSDGIIGKTSVSKQTSLESSRNPILNSREASVQSCDYPTDGSDLESDEVSSPTVETAKKESKWVKLRKAIRWHPFTQSYKKEYPFIQLAGHAGSFKPGNEGTILKLSSKREIECLVKLQTDILRPYIPTYMSEVSQEDGLYVEMQDLLHDFESPSFVMDCKMGIRTYLEDEVNKVGAPREDLYQKMVSVDPSEPTAAENESCSCTKSRYMIWREQLSSTATLGFRIEGIKRGDHNPDKDFKKIQTADDVSKVFIRFVENRKDLQQQYIQRLKVIRETLLKSNFFKSYELIGSSLLFVHDATGKSGIWIIDFGKTVALSNGTTINHQSPWSLGNHEDGYLIGLDNIVNIWSNMNFEMETDPPH